MARGPERGRERVCLVEDTRLARGTVSTWWVAEVLACMMLSIFPTGSLQNIAIIWTLYDDLYDVLGNYKSLTVYINILSLLLENSSHEIRARTINLDILLVKVLNLIVCNPHSRKTE